MINCEVFSYDDDSYMDWLEIHRSGYVLNADRLPSFGHLSLHRSTCWTINRELPKGRHWTWRYLKACADTRMEVEVWARKTYETRQMRLCRYCRPDQH